MAYPTPSSRFSRTTGQDRNKTPNMFAPPKPRSIVDENAINLNEDAKSYAQVAYAKPKPAEERPGSKPPPGKVESYATVAREGFEHSAVPATTDAFANAASIGSNVAQGALSGALAGATIGAAGGPITAGIGAGLGAGVALVTSGLNAWVGNRQARAERDRINALNADARRLNAEQIARDQEWKIQNRMDDLEEAGYQRRKYAEQKAREQYEKTGERMKAILASNTAAKAQWAQFGFV